MKTAPDCTRAIGEKPGHRSQSSSQTSQSTEAGVYKFQFKLWRILKAILPKQENSKPNQRNWKIKQNAELETRFRFVKQFKLKVLKFYSLKFSWFSSLSDASREDLLKFTKMINWLKDESRTSKLFYAEYDGGRTKHKFIISTFCKNSNITSAN